MAFHGVIFIGVYVHQLLFLWHLNVKNLEHTEKLEELCSEHTYTHHLDSVINIFLFALEKQKSNNISPLLDGIVYKDLIELILKENEIDMQLDINSCFELCIFSSHITTTPQG